MRDNELPKLFSVFISVSLSTRVYRSRFEMDRLSNEPRFFEYALVSPFN